MDPVNGLVHGADPLSEVVSPVPLRYPGPGPRICVAGSHLPRLDSERTLTEVKALPESGRARRTQEVMATPDGPAAAEEAEAALRCHAHEQPGRSR